MVWIDRANRRPDLLCHLEDGRGELGPGVTVLVAVQEGRPATEDVAEALELDPQRGAGRRAAPRSPAGFELDVQADLHAALEQRGRLAVLALDHRADGVDRAHLDRL